MQTLNLSGVDNTPGKPSALCQHRLALRRSQAIHLNGLTRAAQSLNHRRVRQAYTELRHTNDKLQLLADLEADLVAAARQEQGRNRYVVSSLFLTECFRELTKTPDEHFVFITGAVVEGRSVLDQKLAFGFETQSVMGVTADPRSTHQLLIRLEQFRHKLLATFHSHPGRGPESIHPSGTDERFQQRLEAAGHSAVMAIFSRDGYIRFLRLDQNLEIETYGEGVTQHETNLYQLTQLD